MIYEFENLKLNEIEISGTIEFNVKSYNMRNTPSWDMEEDEINFDLTTLTVTEIYINGSHVKLSSNSDVVVAAVAGLGKEKLRKLLQKKIEEYADKYAVWS